MQRHALQDGIVLFELEAVRRVLAVLLGHVTGSARHARVLMFSAFEDDLNAVTFALLSHLSWNLKSYNLQFNTDVEPIFLSIFEEFVDAYLIDGAHGVGGNLQGHPFFLLRDVETLRLKVRQKTAARLAVGVRDPVARDRPLPGELTNFGHGLNAFVTPSGFEPETF